MSHSQEIIVLLDRLKKEKSKEDIDATLTLIEELANEGVDEPVLMTLLDLILETKRVVSHSTKRYLLDNCLLPRSELPVSIFLKVISGIGATRVYYQGNRKLKTKKPSTEFQISLLKWMIDNFKYFEKSLTTSGTFVLSILVKNLAYEFSRAVISQLIIIILSSNNSTQFKTFYNSEIYHNIRLLKNHHIQQVVDLYNKFPLDIYLSELLAFFKVVVPDLDYIIYSPDNYPMLNKLISNPDQLYRWDESNTVDSGLSKRQKRMGRSNGDDIYGIQALDQIHKLNAYKILRSSFNNDNSAQLIVILLQAGHSDFNRKINLYIKASLDGTVNEEYDRISLLRKLSKIYQFSGGAIHLSAVEDYILTTGISKNNPFKEMEYRSLLIRYFINVSPTRIADMIKRDAIDLKEIYYSDSTVHAAPCTQYVESVLYLLKSWNSEEYEDFIQALNLIIPKLYMFIQYCKTNQEWLTRETLRFIHELDEHILEDLNDNVLLPPRSLIYSCLLSYDPLVLATICEHIYICKEHNYNNSNWRDFENSFIMDSVNMLWKERFLKQEPNISNSSAKGFYLNPEFTRKLSTLHSSDQLSIVFQSIGELFYNPALSFIITKLIWDIEDKTEEINTRHEGPVSRDSLERIRIDSDKIWLNITFEELKVTILRNLDTAHYGKFKGIGDLLFNSLKSLSDKRLS
ncbi:hypothetical protein K4I79_001653 [Candida tropicalis]